MGLELARQALAGATFGNALDLLQATNKEKVKGFYSLAVSGRDTASDVFFRKCVQVSAAAVNVGILFSSSLRSSLFFKSITFFSNPFIPAVAIGAVFAYVIANHIIKGSLDWQDRIVRNENFIHTMAHYVMIVSSFTIAYFSSSIVALSFAASLTLGQLNDKVFPTSMTKYVDWTRFAVTEAFLVTCSDISVIYPITAAALLAGHVYFAIRDKGQQPV